MVAEEFGKLLQSLGFNFAYDTKLAAAFAKWSKIPDTKWVPGVGLQGATA